MILLSISCLLPWRKRWDSVRSKRFESEYTAYYHSSSVLSVFIIILAGKILHPAVICSTTIWRLLPPLQFPFTFLYCASISWDQNATRRWAWIFFAFLFFFFLFCAGGVCIYCIILLYGFWEAWAIIDWNGIDWPSSYKYSEFYSEWVSSCLTFLAPSLIATIHFPTTIPPPPPPSPSPSPLSSYHYPYHFLLV